MRNRHTNHHHRVQQRQQLHRQLGLTPGAATRSTPTTLILAATAATAGWLLLNQTGIIWGAAAAVAGFFLVTTASARDSFTQRHIDAWQDLLTGEVGLAGVTVDRIRRSSDRSIIIDLDLSLAVSFAAVAARTDRLELAADLQRGSVTAEPGGTARHVRLTIHPDAATPQQVWTDETNRPS